ncbi:short-chain dehydrogenase [Paenibacillus sp. 598K]|uniref:(S)-benzoin forming benzil reductase n=1 Tax=Paenibacillus sp. 598K TaxID=1117987 RepID=UPI000FFAA537|nr:(S)-benzoin forming benzil reductase [Paenibacillus sp. 598K]GBF76513.1 short-chain dehydrogenase [Paenibacillus sp. 598K]
MKAYIITGTSRGIGEALAEQLAEPGNRIYCIARTANDKLAELAAARNATLSHHPHDLNDLQGIPGLLGDILASIRELSDLEAVYLINNAGMLAPVMPIGQCPPDQIVANVSINLLAPMLLTARFIELTETWAVDKRILNVSSGSAKYLLPNQSCYSTAKSGLDSFTKSIHLEQQQATAPVKIASVYPGVIDTQMQAEIRSTSKQDFPYVDQFIQLEKEGLLQTPAYTAEKLLALLTSEAFGDAPLVEQL